MNAIRWVLAFYIGVVRHTYKIALLAAVILSAALGLIYLLQDYLVYLMVVLGVLVVGRVALWLRIRRW